MTIPFNAMDEMFMHLDDPTRPLVVHLEVRVDAPLDEERLREAVQVAAGRHPLARARLLPWKSDAKNYEWIVDERPQIDPLRAITKDGSAALDDIHATFFSSAITLFESPPFRVLLVHDVDGDHVMLAANHTACDGIGALRIMQSVGRAYAGLPDPTADVDPTAAHRLATPPSDGPGLGDRIDNARLSLRQAAQARSRLAKVAAADGTPGPGYRIHTMSVRVAPVVASPMRRRLHATVNDVLLAAVHRSIGEWNRQHGARTGRISIGMPVNARPEAWRYDVVGNLITSEMVTTLASERQSPEACLAAVAGWTEAFKRRGSGAALVAQARGWGGRVTQRRAFGTVLRVVAGFFSGTAAVSNLGSVAPDWVGSEQFEVREMWFSPPAFGADLAVGAVTVNDTLHVTMRYAPALFSSDTAADFAGLLCTELDTLCGS